MRLRLVPDQHVHSVGSKSHAEFCYGRTGLEYKNIYAPEHTNTKLLRPSNTLEYSRKKRIQCQWLNRSAGMAVHRSIATFPVRQTESNGENTACCCKFPFYHLAGMAVVLARWQRSKTDGHEDALSGRRSLGTADACSHRHVSKASPCPGLHRRPECRDRLMGSGIAQCAAEAGDARSG